MRWVDPQLPAQALVVALGGPVAAHRRLGLPKWRVEQWGRRGVLWDVYDADRWAVRAGLHPWLVWPEWYGLPDKELRP